MKYAVADCNDIIADVNVLMVVCGRMCKFNQSDYESFAHLHVAAVSHCGHQMWLPQHGQNDQNGKKTRWLTSLVYVTMESCQL